MKQKNYLPPEGEFIELAPKTPVLTGSLQALIEESLSYDGDEASWSYDGEVGEW